MMCKARKYGPQHQILKIYEFMNFNWQKISIKIILINLHIE
jgi:hypothetical protein